MRIRKLIAAVALAAGVLGVSGALGADPASADQLPALDQAVSLAPVQASADQKPYDSGIQTEHNLCQIMRPYGVGTLTGHYRLSGTNRQCLVCIGDSHYGYRVVFRDGYWGGPHGTTYVGAC